MALAVVGALLVPGSPAHAAVSTTPDRTASFNGTVWATAYAGNTVYVGGDFTAALVGGRRVARSRLAAVDATTGALLPWAPSADARVKALAVGAGSVYAAGDFTAINGLPRDSLARLDAGSATLHGTFRHSIVGRPYALALGTGRLYLGGSITSVNGQARARLAAFNLTSGALDGGWKPTADDQVETLLAATGRIYLGGKFHKIDGKAGTSRLAAVTPASGSVDPDFRPRAAVIVYSVGLSGDGGVVVAHGGQGGRVVAYTATGAARWTATFDGNPQAAVVLGDTVYVGGHFDNACRSSRTGVQGACVDGPVRRVKLAALSLANGSLRSWTANGNGVIGVLTMAVNKERGGLAVGGAFTTINDAAYQRFAHFH